MVDVFALSMSMLNGYLQRNKQIVEFYVGVMIFFVHLKNRINNEGSTSTLHAIETTNCK